MLVVVQYYCISKTNWKFCDFEVLGMLGAAVVLFSYHCKAPMIPQLLCDKYKEIFRFTSVGQSQKLF